MAKNDSGMRGNRTRNQDGRLRLKRSDTKAGTIEKQYGVDLDTRTDMKLGTLRKRTGDTGLKDILHDT